MVLRKVLKVASNTGLDVLYNTNKRIKNGQCKEKEV